MPRIARIKEEGAEGYFHCYGRSAGKIDDRPFNEKGAKRKFINTLKFYSEAFSCQVYAFTVLGNHYHIAIHFDQYIKLSQEELENRAKLLYPNTYAQTEKWSDEAWENFNRRLFDVSELMRNIHSSYARWYNSNHDRRGRFWADRFKSTLLYGEETMRDCMEYIELNAVRADISKRPEDYTHSSLAYREIGKDDWLIDLATFLNENSEDDAIVTYKSRIYFRGGVKTKENQCEIQPEVIEVEMKSGFSTKSIFRKRCRYFNDGLILGAKEEIQKWIGVMHEIGIYRRRKNPIEQGDGLLCSLREQRSHGL